MDVRRAAAIALTFAVALGAGYWLWHVYLRGDEAIIRERLEDLAAAVNEGTTDGLGLVARAATIGSFFAEDVVVDFGDGSPPIHGRDTVMGTAARLQPRTPAFTVALDDVTVHLTGELAAEVSLTATFTRDDPEGRDESIDARELNVGMRKIEGTWLIAHVMTVETLNKR